MHSTKSGISSSNGISSEGASTSSNCNDALVDLNPTDIMDICI